jgi:hypothetical protein
LPEGQKIGVVMTRGGTGLAVKPGMNRRLSLKIRVALKMAQRIGTSLPAFCVANCWLLSNVDSSAIWKPH